MTEILAKLRETLQNPLMHKEVCSHMQDLLHEFNLAKEEKGLEWPLCRTLNSLTSWQEEEDQGLPMMHSSLDDIQQDMARAKIFKEKTMSSNSDTTSQRK